MQDSGIPSSPSPPPAHAPLRTDIDFSRLFDALQDETQVEPQSFLIIGEEVQSRFDDMSCPRETALKNPPGRWPYLHANRVNLIGKDKEPLVEFIAAQAPTLATYETFWRGVFENTTTLIDLRQEKEKRKDYFPEEKGAKVKLGPITIVCVAKEVIGNGFEIHQYKVAIGKVKKLVTRIHFSGWKDHQGLKGRQELDKLVLLLSLADALSDKQLATMAHCTAGVGRTGTLMVAAALRKLHTAGKLNRNNYEETIRDLIIQARQQRGPHTVERASQLETLYRFAEGLIDGSLHQYQVIPALFGQLLTNIRIQQLEVKTAQVSQHALQEPAGQTTFPSIETVYRIHEQRVLYVDQTVEFEMALNDLLWRAIADEIPAEIKDELVTALTAIKAEAIMTAQIPDSRIGSYIRTTGLTGKQEDIESGEEKVERAKLNDAQVGKINFVMNLLSTEPVPKEVMDHPAFLSSLMCCTFGRKGINPTDIWPGEELRNIVLANVKHLVIAGNSVHPEKWIYLLRPSTSRRGAGSIRTFTLSMGMPRGFEAQVRLGYDSSDNKWMLGDKIELEEFRKKRREDKVFASCIVGITDEQVRDNKFDTLENLISITLAWIGEIKDPRQAYPLAQDLLERPCMIVWKGPKLLADDTYPLLLRGASNTYLQFSEELPGEPFVLPDICWENPAVLKSLLEYIFYRQPLNIETGDLPLALLMGQALQSDPLCRQLAPQVLRNDPGYVSTGVEQASNVLIEAPNGTYFIRQSSRDKNVCRIHLKRGPNIEERSISIKNGTFIIMKLKEEDPEPDVFPTIRALIRSLGIDEPKPLKKI